ncbi:uncharacterized protein E0L32_003185 [Thyridium curvatum]|uniref:FAD dependent oxidoreductase domain-containing protein n=1 Tax=Thyridium curvatum TaxID=1093900 RepID=A0A507B5L3_9PEZI|nr:uncharacterized protein E0L32_003185 [Thyridium curvatum]TPX17542.1 hypothetical protein E0L32_003185 [Thyridium curvatum]
MAAPSSSSPRPTIVIIGAGVIGLTCALSIQDALPEKSYDVLIVAQEWPGQYDSSADYASAWAGAHVRPIPASTPQLVREAAWLRRTAEVFCYQAAREPWTGVIATPAVELLASPDAAYRAQTAASFAAETGLTGYRALKSSELPVGTTLGFGYDTYCVNAPVYCTALLRRFLLRGGRTLKRSLRSVDEAFALPENHGIVKLVVNASGVGFGDPKSFPTRGQIVLTNLTVLDPKTTTRQNTDGTWSFVIPRALEGGTIIGGTKEPHDWCAEPRLATRQTLLSKALTELGTEALGLPKTTTSLGAEVVIKDVVGRRPTREGGMRIEVEKPDNSRGRRGPVVHAYGAGGRGFEISWGVAEEVAGLVISQVTPVKARL